MPATKLGRWQRGKRINIYVYNIGGISGRSWE